MRIFAYRCLLGLVVVVLSGCAGCPYSFTGSSVPPHLKTIAIPLLDDQSGSGEPGLREKLTNRLVERFRQDNSLQIGDRTKSDALLEGTIIGLTDEAAVVAGGETVTRKRVTMTLKMVCQDMKLRKKLYDKQFVSWGDWEISGGPSQRQTAIDAAIDKITEDILLETVSGW